MNGRRPNSTGEQPLLLTLEDAGAVLSVGRSTVYSLINAGELRSVLIGRQRRVSMVAIQQYIAKLEERAS